MGRPTKNLTVLWGRYLFDSLKFGPCQLVSFFLVDVADCIAYAHCFMATGANVLPATQSALCGSFLAHLIIPVAFRSKII
jgi:hypothetical protein